MNLSEEEKLRVSKVEKALLGWRAGDTFYFNARTENGDYGTGENHGTVGKLLDHLQDGQWLVEFSGGYKPTLREDMLMVNPPRRKTKRRAE